MAVQRLPKCKVYLSTLHLVSFQVINARFYKLRELNKYNVCKNIRINVNKF